MRYVCLSIVLLCGISATANAEWADLWRTPEQRAADSFKEGNHEALLKQAPNDDWTGLGQFQSGDYDTASQTFSEQAINEQLNGDSAAANRALYNQGVSDAMAGRYQEALTSFDTVLSDDPEFVDAVHNREIAQKLMELEQQQQQQQEGDQGDQSQEGEQGEQSQEGEQGEEGEEGDQGEQAEQGDSADQSQEEQGQQSDESSGSEGDKANEADNADDSDSQSDAEQAAEEARQALAAEAQKGEEQEGADAEQSEAMGAEVEERPLSESEQATEQWLRRIPDDPAGLLRRKLEQSHRNEFPEVRDAAKPW